MQGLSDSSRLATLSWKQLEAALAKERLLPYLQHTSGDPSKAIALYLWNIALSESLYSLINLSEITLRNKFHQALTKKFNRQDWYESSWLDKPSALIISKAKEKLTKRRLDVTAGRVVAELNFGFWTSLLNVKYEHNHTLWPALAPEIFKNVPRRLRTRKHQSPFAARLRILRNRIFHHEPIWYWPNLANQVKEAETWLYWLNPDVASLHSLVENFNSVYCAGVEAMPSVEII